MKQPYLSELINRLTKIRDEYVTKHDVEPVIFDWRDDHLELCSKLVTENGAVRSISPYKRHKLSQKFWLGWI